MRVLYTGIIALLDAHCDRARATLRKARSCRPEVVGRPTNKATTHCSGRTDLTRLERGVGLHESKEKWISAVALSTAFLAAFAAAAALLSSHYESESMKEHGEEFDKWSYYQSKGTKLNIAENALDQLTLQKAITPAAAALIDARIAIYEKQIAKYQREKEDIRKTAEASQKEYDALNFHDDQFDMSDACLSVAIALFGITALTRKRWLIALACTFMLLGLVFGLAGFFSWKIHPDFFARWLS